jgi:hypothetical protein
MFVRNLPRFLHWNSARRGRSRRKVARRARVLKFCALEDRTLLTTFQVLNLLDSGPGSLREAVSNANSNPGADVIKFANGLAGNIPLTSGEIVISDDLTIEGRSGIAVSGGGTDRIFDVAAQAKVAIRSLTLADGSANQGGAILNETGSTLSLIGCTLDDNQAIPDASGNAVGGAVFIAPGALLKVDACRFQNNQTTGTNESSGGAIANAGMVAIASSTFDGNQALGGTNGAGADGGAVTNFHVMTIDDTQFNGNFAHAGPNADGVLTTGTATGGAIRNAGAPDGSFFGVLAVADCRFVDNQAIGGDNAGAGSFFNGAGLGGALGNVDESFARVTDCVFSRNQAIAGAGAGSPAMGGAIWNDHDAKLSVAESTIRCNKALGGSSALNQLGGEAFGGGIDNQDASIAKVDGCTIEGNIAVGGAGTVGGNGGFAGGGGLSSGGRAILFNVHDPCSLTVTQTLILHNRVYGGMSGGVPGDLNSGADGLGGGLFFADGPVHVDGCTFQFNEAIGGAGINGPAGDGYGGAIAAGYNGGTAILDLDATVVSSNRAVGGHGTGGDPNGEGRAGGLYITGGARVFLAGISVVVGNSASTDSPDIFGAYIADEAIME